MASGIFEVVLEYGTFMFKRKLRRVHADDDQSHVFVFRRPAFHVRHRTQGVDTGIRPEVNQHDLAAQRFRCERAGVEPADGTVQLRHRRRPLALRKQHRANEPGHYSEDADFEVHELHLSRDEVSALEQLLAAINIESCSGHRCVRHEVDRQGSNVGGANDALDR